MGGASWDVIVVGAGMAGLTAGLRALAAGARTLLVECAEAAGGSARLSSGFLASPLSAADFLARNGGGDPRLGRAVVETYPALIDWLVAEGARLGPHLPDIMYGTLQGHPVREGMPALVEHLAARVTERGGVTRYGERALGLRRLGSGALELSTTGAAGAGTYLGRAVVLATGGFQVDAARVARWITPWADHLILRSNPHSRGDGLQLGEGLGAALSGTLDRFYGHLVPPPPAVITPATASALNQFWSPHALLLNRRGERFIDESTTDEHNAWAVSQQEQATAWLVFDAQIHREYVARPPNAAMATVDRLQAVREAGGLTASADTLTALAAGLAAHGLPEAATLATLRAYQAHAAGGQGGTACPPKARFRHPLASPPYHAIKVVPALYFTYGGLRVDTEGRVLDAAGAPVVGLYAAGNDVGGVHYDAYAGGLAASAALGYLAGHAAARYSQAHATA